MADLDQNQTSTETGPAETVQTPLDTILDSAADVPARDQEAEAGIGGMGDPQVPLVALRKERERRKKSDRQVEELRAELQRFEDSKYGFDQESVDEVLRQGEQEQRQADEATQSPAERNWKQSEARHKADEAKINAGLKRLNAEQQQQVQEFVKTQASGHPDPVGAIRNYVDQLGLLDFKNTPIDQVLASKDKAAEPQQDASEYARHIEQLNRYAQEVNATEKRAHFLADKVDFVSEHGKGAYDALDQMTIAFTQSGHPAVQQFVQAVTTSSEPVTTAARLLYQLGVGNAQVPQRAPQQQMAFPSDFASRRSVGARTGPSYSGPTPLDSIFRN